MVDADLAGLAQPHGPAEWRELANLGVGLVVCLARHAPDQADLAPLGLDLVHLPVPDFRAPTPAQVRVLVRAVREARAAGRAVAVCCRAGLGRTGTALACVLVDRGLAPEEAILAVRAARPGSIETTNQVRAIHTAADRQHGQEYT
ncbi:MAG: protein-tyrosine phosphatase family protein [Propionibacteriaceae bacterium]|nr:protein-tyrosine phosphatase family protein [Propionibacteriaceae bacterium]